MHRVALALLAVLLLSAACTSRPARHDRSHEVSYNRRELPPSSPGLFTGPDGTWTVYCNDAAPPPEGCAAPRQDIKTSCQEGDACDRPPEPR